VVVNLPGVARAAWGRSDIVVWGAAPRDTRVFVDGVEIPTLFHLGGFRSVVGAGLIDTVALVPGAFGVEQGRAIGGTVDVTTRTLDPEGPRRPEGMVAVDPIDLAGQVTFSPSSRSRAVVAARASLFDRWWPLVVPAGVGDFVAVPQSLDAQGKVTFALRDREEITMGLLAMHDRLTRTVDAVDPTDDRRDEQRLGFGRLYGRYARRGGGLGMQATAWLGLDERAATTATGPAQSTLRTTTPSLGARAWLRHRLDASVALQTGVDALIAHAEIDRSGSLVVPPREGDPTVFGAVAIDDRNADRWTTLQVDIAPFVAADLTWGPVSISPGLRLDAWALSSSRLTPRVGTTPSIGTSRIAFTPDPRLAVVWKATPWLSLRAAAGRYHQPPPVEDTSAVFGAPRANLERAVHVAAGGMARVLEGIDGAVDVDVTVFHRLAEGLVSRVPSASPPLAAVLQNEGVGVATGASVAVRRMLGGDGAFGWLAYTLSRSARQDHAAAFYRVADFDQTHVLTAVAAVPLGPLVGSVRARAATGMPRTPVVGAVFDARRDRFEPVFGPTNTERLPPFFQLDARAETTLRVAPFLVDLSAELQNVTAHANAEEVVYAVDYTDRAFVTGVPFLAVAGVRVRF
jgi:hypothetical protein